MSSVQRLSDTSGDWLARDKAEDYNGLSVAAGRAPASLRTLASESVAGQAGHLARLPESPLETASCSHLPHGNNAGTFFCGHCVHECHHCINAKKRLTGKVEKEKEMEKPLTSTRSGILG